MEFKGKKGGNRYGRPYSIYSEFLKLELHNLDFRQFSYVPFPDSSDFRQCLKSEQKRLDFGHFFLSENQTLKNPNGTLDFRQKKVSEI